MASAAGASREVTAEHLLQLLGSPRPSSLPPRHQLVLEGADNSPWCSLVWESVLRDYPAATEDERITITVALCKAFAAATEATYVSRMRDFAQFCFEHEPQLPVLPCTKQHVHLYLAHVARRGSLAAESMPQVVSTINSVHRLLGLTVPVVDDGQHRLLMAGLNRILLPLHDKVPKRPLLVQWLDAAIELALAPEVDSVFCRNVVAVCVGYACGFRGSTLAAMELGDVQLTGMTMRVNARVRKARGQLATQLADWEFFLEGHPRFRRLLSTFLSWRQLSDPSGSLWRWSGVEPRVTTALTEGVVDLWVQSIVAKVAADMQPTSYSSHSMRVGTASGLNALGVSRDMIRLWVRWASTDMLDLYIRPVPSHPALDVWFGWMLRRPPAMRA
jgi:integrase